MDKRALIENLKGSIASLESSVSTSDCKLDREGRPSQKEGPSSPTESSGINEKTKADHPLDSSHCLASALRSLKAYDQPTSKVRLKLSRKGYPDAVVEETICKLIELGYLDDVRYADAYIRSRIERGKGIAGIKRDLRAAGINVDELDSIFEEYTSEALPEHVRAYDYLVAHPPRSKNARESAYRKLVSHGYSSDSASRAARRWSSEQ